MSAEKPVVFISHATEEAETANAAETMLRAAFGGNVQVFNTSNARSLTAGDPWREQITSGLAVAEVALVLCSPRSINNNWINFEAGGAWLNGTRLIPCCVRGLEPTKLKRPLSDLQAVNLNELEGVAGWIDHMSRILNLPILAGFESVKALEWLKASWQKDARSSNLELIEWYSKATLRPERFKGSAASGLFHLSGFSKTVNQEVAYLPNFNELGLMGGDALRCWLGIFGLPKEIELNRSLDDKKYCYISGDVADLVLDSESEAIMFGTVRSFGLIDTAFEGSAEANWRCGWYVEKAVPAYN